MLFIGFGKHNLSVSNRSLSFWYFFHGRITGKNGLEKFGGSCSPLPTTDRQVSGRVNTTAVRVRPDVMERNQKIHLHPGPNAKDPPINGPILGAVVILIY
jgi:hypothetical protein